MPHLGVRGRPANAVRPKVEELEPKVLPSGNPTWVGVRQSLQFLRGYYQQLRRDTWQQPVPTATRDVIALRAGVYHTKDHLSEDDRQLTQEAVASDAEVRRLEDDGGPPSLLIRARVDNALVHSALNRLEADIRDLSAVAGVDDNHLYDWATSLILDWNVGWSSDFDALTSAKRDLMASVRNHRPYDEMISAEIVVARFTGTVAEDDHDSWTLANNIHPTQPGASGMTRPAPDGNAWAEVAGAVAGVTRTDKSRHP